MEKTSQRPYSPRGDKELSQVKTLAIGEVSEMGLKSFLTDFGGRRFGTVATMACFCCVGK